MPRIFISYRRSDSQGATGRIHENLVQHFGESDVFIDLFQPVGADFREYIRKSITQSDVLLVIIGQRWADKGNRRRLGNATDLVRIEIETALAKSVAIIPVRVDDATMPALEMLPESIREFVYRHGTVVSSGREFHAHIGSLIKSIELILQEREAKTTQATNVLAPAPRWGIDDDAIKSVTRGAELPSKPQLSFDQATKRARRVARRIIQYCQLIHTAARVDRNIFTALVIALVSVNAAASALALGLATSATEPRTSWHLALSVVIFGGWILVTIRMLALAVVKFRGYNLEDGVREARIRSLNKINRFDQEFSIDSLKPAPEESLFRIAKAAFAVRGDITLMARDCYQRLEQFDNYLMNLSRISYHNLGDRRFTFLSETKSIKRNQLSYLISRLKAAKILPTVNEMKCGISMDLGPPITNVKIYKVGYFDSLMTNEAFRSEIYFGSKLITGDSGDLHSVINLTASFPAAVGDGGSIYLQPLRNISVGNHIGVTCIVVTQDNRVLLFRQGDTNVDRGTVTGISGSLDWDDLTKSDDLLSAVRRGMGRELCEEASGARAYRRQKNIYRSESRIADASRRVIVTGFFRWVDRCGKPEFIGVGRTPFEYAELPPDEFEVTSFPMTEINNFVLRRMLDFHRLIELLHAQIRKTDGLRMGLSSYLALKRLCEIATYESSEDQEQRRLFQRVSDFLRLS